MVARISTLQLFSEGVIAMQNQQASLQKTQLQIATGLRISKPSDDPSGATTVLDLKSSMAQLEQYSRNSAMAEAALGFEESVITNINTNLQRIRELTVQGNNSIYPDKDRASIAAEIYQRLDELVALANTRNPQGEYIFGGFQVESPPFVESGDSIQYVGDEGERLLQVGDRSQVVTRDSGAEVFQRIRAGDGQIQVAADTNNSGTAVVGDFGLTGGFVNDSYTVSFAAQNVDGSVSYEVTDSGGSVVVTGNYREGSNISFAGAQFRLDGVPANGDVITVEPSRFQDVFTTVRNIADALSRPQNSIVDSARFHNEMGQGLANLDQALAKMTATRANIGSRLNNLETLEEINQDFKLQLETTLSETQDLDYAEAISRMNLELTSLQAAQQAYIKTTGLSLFQFI